MRASSRIERRAWLAGALALLALGLEHLALGSGGLRGTAPAEAK